MISSRTMTTLASSLFALSLTLTAPLAQAADKPAAKLAEMTIPAIISVNLVVDQHGALPSGSKLTVQLTEKANADANPKVVADEQLSPSGQAPTPYKLYYDAVLINPRYIYQVSAKLVAGGKTLFTAEPAPVITAGSPGHVDLLLKKPGVAK